jgi:hypothetical protein
VENFSDIPQYVLSRLNLTQEKPSYKDNEMDYSQNSQSGMILQHLMADLGKGELISFPGGSRVKTFQQQEKALASRGNGQDSGEKWQGWLTKYDPDLCLWKTPQCSLLEDYIEFSETFPAWGTMRDGACWGLMMPEQGTEESGSGFLPTPTSSDASCGAVLNENTKMIQLKSGKLRKISNNGVSGSIGLARTVKLWPTPTTRDYKDGQADRFREGKLQLDTVGRAVMHHEKNYPTPTATDSIKGGNVSPRPGAMGLSETTGGQLNPDWVEWLMGWPIGWSSLQPIDSDEILSWDTDPADSGEIPRVGVKIPNRAKRLKAIGNGQVPAVAAIAFSILSEGIL